MGKIPTTTFRTTVAGPVVTRRITGAEISGARGLQELGRGVTALGDAIQRRDEQNEIADVTAQMSKAHADFTTQFQETFRTADPGDKTIAETLTRGLDDHLEQMRENVSTRGGRLHFQKSAAAMQAQFALTAGAGQAELAGAKAREDYLGSLTNSSAALLNDPTAFGMALERHGDTLDALVKGGGLSTKAATQLRAPGRTDLAKSSIRGWIRVAPEEAKTQLTAGTWDKFIDGDLKKQLFGEADTALRGRDVENARRNKADKDALKEAQRVIQNDFLQRLEGSKLTPRDILESDLEPTGGGSKRQFLNMIDVQNKQKITTDSAVYGDVWDRIHLPEGDPRRLVDENELNPLMGKGLTVEDISRLRKEMQGQGTQKGKDEAILKTQLANIAKAKLVKTNPLLGIRDPEGESAYQSWLVNMQEEFNEEIRKGTIARELLDPRSPKYLGNSINQFQKTPKQIIESLSKQISADPDIRTEKPKPTKPIEQRFQEILQGK